MAPRTLRRSADAEASILGGILIRPELLAQLDTLEIDDFSDLKHRVVFEALRNLDAQGRPIDVVTVEHEIERAGKLDATGGIAFLGTLTMRVPTADNVLEYARIVQELAMTRRLAVLAGEIVERCYDHDADPAEVLGYAHKQLGALDRVKSDTTSAIGDVVKRRYAELDELADRKARGELAMTGIPTGIAALDRKIGGWQLGVLNLLAGRPAMGKSAVALASTDAATAAGFGAHVFSLEDTRATYADRGLSRRSGVAAELIRQAELTGKRDGLSDFARLGAAVTQLSHRPNWLLDDEKGLTAREIIRRVRKHKKANKTRLVVVDYVHLVKRNPRLEEHQAIDEILTELLSAVEPDEAWLVLSQLNRKLEDRVDKRPQIGDLRGSGALEERTKVIVGLYRGCVYGGKPKREVDFECDCNDAMVASGLCRHELDEAEWQSQLQAIVLKNANGAPGRVFAQWNAPTLEVW